MIEVTELNGGEGYASVNESQISKLPAPGQVEQAVPLRVSSEPPIGNALLFLASSRNTA